MSEDSPWKKEQEPDAPPVLEGKAEGIKEVNDVLKLMPGLLTYFKNKGVSPTHAAALMILTLAFLMDTHFSKATAKMVATLLEKYLGKYK